MTYNELTRRYFENASGTAGVLIGPDCFRGASGSRAQGTWVQFDVQVDSGAGPARIQAVRFLAFACPHIIAVSSWLAEQTPGCEIKAQLPESVQSLRERFDVPIPKLGRLLIVEDAWIAALRAAEAARAPGPE
ncbi:MAG TPA: iron-sulfur cluster assembly scaffold protein [Steroidobacteraceae bacterium]|nr:iron-sulfur cluster assembly scaffold protein [Steroidobacteraceae bacterium]